MPESNKPKGSTEYKGFMSPAPGDLEKKDKKKLSHIYSSIREKQSGSESPEDKAKAAKIAWSQINKDQFWEGELEMIIPLLSLETPFGNIFIDIVDGNYVRKHLIGEKFTQGGNEFAYAGKVPENHLWIENQLGKPGSANEMMHVFVHELLEWMICKYVKLDYEQAHQVCLAVEQVMDIFENSEELNENKITEKK